MSAKYQQLQSLQEEIKRINEYLAPGITASITGQGEIRFSVRVSKQGITGDSQRISLGTFTSYADALRAQIEYKLQGHLKVFPHDRVATLLNSFKELEQQRLQDQLNAIKGMQAVATEKKVQTIEESVKEQHSDAFQILAGVDFTLLDSTRPYNYSSQNGESLTIPANVVAAYFKYLETSPLDDFQS